MHPERKKADGGLAMAREYMIYTFEEAKASGSYDERPMFGDDLDLQIHLSKNELVQPFWLICEHDTVLTTLSGEGIVEFKDSPFTRQTYETGDFIYIPAGMPSRIKPTQASVQYRFKAMEAGLEGIAWYCEKCGNELYREVWDTADELSQQAYLRICEAFNVDQKQRTCKCGKRHPKIDVSQFRWQQVLDNLAAVKTAE
jgi:3-hydroxyanthranilate 3,4-dioxygenase